MLLCSIFLTFDVLISLNLSLEYLEMAQGSILHFYKEKKKLRGREKEKFLCGQENPRRELLLEPFVVLRKLRIPILAFPPCKIQKKSSCVGATLSAFFSFVCL